MLIKSWPVSLVSFNYKKGWNKHINKQMCEFWFLITHARFPSAIFISYFPQSILFEFLSLFSRVFTPLLPESPWQSSRIIIIISVPHVSPPHRPCSHDLRMKTTRQPETPWQSNMVGNESDKVWSVGEEKESGFLCKCVRACVRASPYSIHVSIQYTCFLALTI